MMVASRAARRNDVDDWITTHCTQIPICRQLPAWWESDVVVRARALAYGPPTEPRSPHPRISKR